MALAGGEDNVSCCSAMLRWLLRIWIQLPAPLRYAYLRLRYGHYGVGMAALIHDERGRIMVVHRTYSRDEPWALPGGTNPCRFEKIAADTLTRMPARSVEF